MFPHSFPVSPSLCSPSFPSSPWPPFPLEYYSISTPFLTYSRSVFVSLCSPSFPSVLTFLSFYPLSDFSVSPPSLHFPSHSRTFLPPFSMLSFLSVLPPFSLPSFFRISSVFFLFLLPFLLLMNGKIYFGNR